MWVNSVWISKVIARSKLSDSPLLGSCEAMPGKLCLVLSSTHKKYQQLALREGKNKSAPLTFQWSRGFSSWSVERDWRNKFYSPWRTVSLWEVGVVTALSSLWYSCGEDMAPTPPQDNQWKDKQQILPSAMETPIACRKKKKKKELQWERIDPGKVDRPAQRRSTTCGDFQKPNSWACLKQTSFLSQQLIQCCRLDFLTKTVLVTQWCRFCWAALRLFLCHSASPVTRREEGVQ